METRKERARHIVFMALIIVLFLGGAIFFGYLLYSLTMSWNGYVATILRIVLIFISAMFGGSLGEMIGLVISLAIRELLKK